MSLRLSLSLAVLLVAAAHAAESKPSSPMFVDWIGQQASTKVKAAGYDDLETESVCLTQTKLRNCRDLNSVTVDGTLYTQREYAESTLACCDHDGPGSFMTEKPLLGVCNWVADYFTKAIEYDGTNTEKIGVFTVKCEMREDSEKCGSPLCEGMSLDGSGDILRYPKVAFVGDAAKEGIFLDKACEELPPNPLEHDVGRPTPAPRPSAPAPAPAPRTPAKVQWQEEDTVRFYIGEGDIYSGTFRVTSRFHATKARTGQIQLAYPSQPLEDVDPVTTVPERAYVAKPHQVHLEFIKGGEGY